MEVVDFRRLGSGTLGSGRFMKTWKELAHNDFKSLYSHASGELDCKTRRKMIRGEELIIS